MKKIKCTVCETEFIPTTDLHYIARKGTVGIFATDTYYDAYDCPQCGSQIVAKERRRAVHDYTAELEERLEDEGTEQAEG